MPGRHDWNTWDNYLSTHLRRLRDFEHLIVHDELTITATNEVVSWDGELYCVDGVEIHVRKLQRVAWRRQGRPMVRTSEYSYHVLQRRASVAVNLFRYDNIHTQPGHPDRHHRHNFTEDGTEVEPATHIGEAEWPTLGDVLQEIDDWRSKSKGQ